MFKELDDTRFNLIVIGQPAPAELSTGLASCCSSTQFRPSCIERELARVQIPQPHFFCCVQTAIGLAGTRLEVAAVNRYVAERLHLAPRSAES